MNPPAPLALVEWPGLVAYEEALERQFALVEQRRAGGIGDTLVLLEHAPVYTIGRTPDRTSLGAAALLPHPVHETNRGGQATYHGPGQLTGYLICDLENRGRDLHRHLRFIEQGLIDACAGFGVAAGRRPGLTGAWVGGRKLASIGVGVRRWVSMHGFGLNLDRRALAGFAAITPCGLADVQTTR
jgi:lipoyl(octanoyl) transferase